MTELSTTIVAALYQGVLGRAAEPAALADTAAWLDEHGVAGSLGGLVERFVTSTEFRARVNTTGFLAEAPSPHWAERPAYRHVVSLGSNCYASQMLKAQGLKRYSAPFDWIFSSVPMVGHCLRDDFATLLDRSQMHALPERPEAVGLERSEHAFYRDAFGVPKMFNHHDMTLDSDYGYLRRCVERMRRVLAGGEPTLCLLVMGHRRAPLDEVLALSETLRAVAPHADLVCVEVTEPGQGGLGFSMTTLHESPGRLVMRFVPTSGMGPLWFRDPFDDMLMHRLVRSFRFDLAG